MKLCKNPKILASRLQRPGMTSSLKKLLADCFKTLADGPKTGLLAARAISTYMQFLRITLIGGPAGRAGWRAVFPNEKRDNRLYDYSSWMLHAVAALRLKAAESFLETMPVNKNTTAWKCRKIRITRCEKSRFYLVLAKIWIKNRDKQKISIKKNVRNHSYYQFHPVLAKNQINRIRITRGLLLFQFVFCHWHDHPH